MIVTVNLKTARIFLCDDPVPCWEEPVGEWYGKDGYSISPCLSQDLGVFNLVTLTYGWYVRNQ